MMAYFCIRGALTKKKLEIFFATEVRQFIHQSKALVKLIINMLFSKMFIGISGPKKPKIRVKNTYLLNYVLKNQVLGLKFVKSDRFSSKKKLNIISLFIFFKMSY
jgi:hypothetical protein